MPLFCNSFEPSMVLITLFPSIVICALAVATLVNGLVTLLGKSWAFLAWTMMQVIITLSSPFVPIEKLPHGFKEIALLSPFTYLFEFVREPSAWLLGLATAQGIILLLLGLKFMQRMVDRVKMDKGFHHV